MVMHIFVCALVCVLFLFSLINVNDAVLQQEQPARRRRSAMNTMDNICKNYKKFLKCDGTCFCNYVSFNLEFAFLFLIQEISIEYHQGTYGLVRLLHLICACNAHIIAFSGFDAFRIFVFAGNIRRN